MTTPAYCDLEIHVRKGLDDNSCPVSAHVPSEGRRAEGTLVAPYSDAEITRAVSWMEQGLFDAAYVKEFGTRLFEALFVGEIKAVYDGSRQSAGARLRIRLIIDSPAVARIPWELLYDPERDVFLSLEGPLVRDASITEATRPLVVQPPLRILVVDAFPRGVLS